jgi:uncharacterized membrane protein
MMCERWQMNVKLGDLLSAWVGCTIVLTLEMIEHPLIQQSRLITGGVLLALVLYLLYAALTVVLYDHFRLDLRIALTISVFISATIFIGIVLNSTPWGLTRHTWIASYTVLSGIALITASAGRMVKQQQTPVKWGLRPKQAAMIGLGGTLFVASFLLANVGMRSQPGEGFTQFWMLPASDAAPTILEIGILNVEQRAETYSIRLLSNATVIEEWSGIELRPDEQWEISYTIPNSGIAYPLVAQLYVPRQEQPYRRTEYWLNAQPVQSLENETP